MNYIFIKQAIWNMDYLIENLIEHIAQYMPHPTVQSYKAMSNCPKFKLKNIANSL